MAQTIETPLITLKGTSSINYAEMLQQNYIDTSGADYVQFEACISYLSGGTLIVDVGDADAEVWSDVLSVTDMSSTYHVGLLSRDFPPGSSKCLRDRMRWNFTGGANWEVCFRLIVTLK